MIITKYNRRCNLALSKLTSNKGSTSYTVRCEVLGLTYAGRWAPNITVPANAEKDGLVYSYNRKLYSVTTNVSFVTSASFEDDKFMLQQANSIAGRRVYGELWGGLILSVDTQVKTGYIYLNKIAEHPDYGSYLYFDAPEMTVSPVAFGDSYGGSVKNGTFARTDRDADNKNSFNGYRAGMNSTSQLAVFNGYQAGEGTTDEKVDSLTGGSVATGVTASFESTASMFCTYGLESGSRATGNWSNFYGGYSGATNAGVGSDGFGFKALQHNIGIYCTGMGYGVLQDNLSNYNTGFGAFVLSSAEGEKNTGGGSRSLSACKGSNNAAWGYRAAFVTGGRLGDNGAYLGSEAGEEDTSTGSSGVGRSSMKGNTGDFASGLGYLAGLNNTYARATMIGQQAVVTGNDQIQLGAAGSTVYAFGAVQDRSDIRDKLEVEPISDPLKNFLLDVEFSTYRVNYRELYIKNEEVQVGIDDNAEPIFEVRTVELENDGSLAGSRRHAGAIAQQVKAAMDKHGVDFAGYQDHLINDGKDVKSLGYQEFIPIIGSIVQDHNSKISELEGVIKDLSDRLAALEG